MSRDSLRRSLLQLACIGLLLVAQQGALTHALWHAHGGEAVGHAHHEPDGESRHHGDEPSLQGELCGFDTAFGQVLGAAGGRSACAIAPLLHPEGASGVAGIGDGLSALSPQSRGPPPPA